MNNNLIKKNPKYKKILQTFITVYSMQDFGNIQSVNFDCELAWAQPIFYDT